MNRKGFVVMVLTLLLVGMGSSLYPTQAIVGDEAIKIVLNDDTLDFDVAPMIKEGRTLVPLRGIYEALGLDVKWNADSQSILGYKEGLKVGLTINQHDAVVNGTHVSIDVAPMIMKNRTLVPVRFIAESTGASVTWDEQEQTVYIEGKKLGAQSDLAIGMDVKEVLEAFGEPKRKDLSKYGFEWYIYNDDYSKYLQVGVKDGKVVGIYTNSGDYKIFNGTPIGRPKDAVSKMYGSPLSHIKKEHVIYQFNTNGGEMDLYHKNGGYITVFYDKYDEYKVTALQIIDEKVEENLKGFYAKTSHWLKESYERQIFDLANSVRAKHGLAAYKWDEKTSDVARKHSEDMAINNYFDHTNLNGQSPFDRLKNGGIQYRMAAENIASGQTSAIFAHQGWMNSEGHRKNILGNGERLGVGVYFGGAYNVYYTQNFYTPR